MLSSLSFHARLPAWHPPVRCTCRLQTSWQRRGKVRAAALKSFWEKMQRRDSLQDVNFSSNADSLSAEAVSVLWADARGEVAIHPELIALALKHTFAVVAAFASASGEEGGPNHLVGLARAVSDGAFAASVVDVAVLPQYQGRRIGRQLMQRLVRACLARGAASCVVFPLPRDRMFFFKAGFRLTRKYSFMRFDVELLDDASRADLERWGRGQAAGALSLSGRSRPAQPGQAWPPTRRTSVL